MNRGETLYAQHLDLRIKIGEIKRYWFEGINLRMAKRTWLKPDFLILMADNSLQLHDVKGAKKKRNGQHGYWIEEDANVKIKTCAEMYRGLFVFKIVWPGEHGTWNSKTL